MFQDVAGNGLEGQFFLVVGLDVVWSVVVFCIGPKSWRASQVFLVVGLDAVWSVAGFFRGSRSKSWRASQVFLVVGLDAVWSVAGFFRGSKSWRVMVSEKVNFFLAVECSEMFFFFGVIGST